MRPKTVFLHLVFFCSGASALIFETLWFRQAGLVLGNSVWASSMVLASFMAGLAIGNALAGRVGSRAVNAVRAYGVMEILIGATGVALVWSFPQLNAWLTPLFQPYLNEPAVLNSLRLGISFGLMLVPTAAMGATLPLMVQGLVGRDSTFGERLGRLYAANTFGAVAGALICEFTLIPTLGIQGTGLAAGACSLFAGLSALVFSIAIPSPQAVVPATTSTELASTATSNWKLLVSAFLCGAALLALEVVWFRYLLLFNFGTSRVFAVMLALVLTGIAAGGLIAARWVKSGNAAQLLPLLALGSAWLTILTYVLPSLSLLVSRDEFRIDFTGMSTLLRALPVMLPVSILSGILFPTIGEVLHRAGQSDSRTAGALTLANTLGAMTGALLGGFVLLPGVGMERSFVILAIAYAVVALLNRSRLNDGPAEYKNWFSKGLIGLTALVVFVPQFGIANGVLTKVAQRYLSNNTRIVAKREGLIDTVMYTETTFQNQPVYHRLVTNTHPMSSTYPGSWQYMKMYVYLPVAIHPAPRKACLISYGCGVTAKALTDTQELTQIDIVDISRDILDLSSVVFPEAADNPLHDPRVTPHIEDGRFFLQTTTEQYDLITSEPPPPKGASIVNLYTHEYFQLIHNRLAPGGMVTYWLPYHGISISDGQAIMRAFLDVFPESSLWLGSGDNLMLLGIREGHQGVDEPRFRAQWNDAKVAPILAACGFESAEQCGSYFIADAEQLAPLLKGAEPLVDNFPQRLSPVAPVDYKSPDYLELVDQKRSRERFETSAHLRRIWPADLIAPSIAYFEQRDYIHDLQCVVPNRFSDWRVSSLAAIHHVQTTSKLRTPVLWSLGTSYQEEQVALKLVDAEPDNLPVRNMLASTALADHRYADAAEYYEANLEKLPADSAALRRAMLRGAYALCMDDRSAEAQSLVDRWLPENPLDKRGREDWDFLRTTFGLTDPATGKGSETAISTAKREP